MGIDCPDWLCRNADECDCDCSVLCDIDYHRRCSDCVLYESCYPKE